MDAVGAVADHHMGLVRAAVEFIGARLIAFHGFSLRVEVAEQRLVVGKTCRRFLKQSDKTVEMEVAVSEEHHVLRTVEAAGEPQSIGGRELPHPLGFPEDVVAQGMVLEEDVVKLIIDQFGGGVIVALNLVCDHFHLFVNLSLGVGAVEHDVAEQVDGAGQVVFQHRSIIDGVFLVGEGIEVTAHTFQTVDDVPGAPARGPFESDMLAEMCQTFLVGRFIA